MSTWGELPLISIAEKTTFNPQFYIAEVIQQVQERAKIYPVAGMLEKFGMKDHCGQTFQGNITVNLGSTGGTYWDLKSGTKVALSGVVTKSYIGTVSEMGNGVKMEKFLLNVSPSDIEGLSVRYALSQDIADMLDTKVRNAIYTATTNKMNAGTYATVGAFITIGTYAIVRMNTQKQINNIDVDMPFYVHPYQNEDLFLDTTASASFVDISKYTEKGVQKVYDLEIGKIGQFRLIPTNRVVGTKEQNGTTGTVDTAVAFAVVPELAVAMAWALPTEFRYEEDYDTDFGRTSALAHYGQGGACKLVDEYSMLVKSTVRSAITGYAIG